jgi:hypothetical protein
LGKVLSGGNQFFGSDGQGFGRADQIGFVVRKKIKRGGKHCWVIQPGAQGIRIKTGEREVSFRAVIVLQQPPYRGKRKRCRARGRNWALVGR